MEKTAPKHWKRLFQELQRGIIAGEYRPRQRLTEDEIIARTGATRHAVRKAFDELVSTGLVSREPNKGVHVRDYTVEEIEEIYEIRTCLEVQAARRYALPATPALIEELTDIATRHSEASRARRFADVFMLNNSFHEVFYARAGNRQLADAIRHYTFVSHPIRTRAFPNDDLREVAIADHFAMIKAIEDGDRAKLARIVEDHIQRPKAFYIQTNFFDMDL